MSTPGQRPGYGQGDPVSDAVYQLALSINADVLKDAGRPLDEIESQFDGQFDARRKEYPYILFGQLAMYIADVRLPDAATVPDRARGVIEALRRISVTPGLLEAVTNAPFTPLLADRLTSDLSASIEKDEDEAADAAELRALVRKNGYVEQSMIPNGRVVQLRYSVDPQTKPSRFSRYKPQPGTEITLRLVPAEKIVWAIKQYRYYSEYAGYTNYIGEREVILDGLFSLIVANSPQPLPRSLLKAVGNKISIGKVSKGSLLKLDHPFSRYTQEIAGYEHDVMKTTVSLPASLQQAFLGETNSYPLFHEDYR